MTMFQVTVIQEGRHQLDAILVEGEQVAVRGVFRGVLKTGEEVTVRFADFHHFRDGLIWRRYSYFMDRFV
ncbi:nuclear transport factor 2 family protein [Thermaerobacter subterraneus]|uniref:nuclear transport factor 2 family protein n=1 Tax=Thermaerobacter subterraneus TaxID=175696 RepID=UPI0001EB5F1A|nr:nuclear transport factor 2 family protein [Thermaerobacter subterraneus]